MSKSSADILKSLNKNRKTPRDSLRGDEPCSVFIAIIDDNEFNIHAGKAVLEACLADNYKIVVMPYHFSSNDSKQRHQAIAQFKSDMEEGLLDAVVTDHDMPDMTGTAVAQFIRAQGTDIPILLNSSDKQYDPLFLKENLQVDIAPQKTLTAESLIKYIFQPMGINVKSKFQKEASKEQLFEESPVVDNANCGIFLNFKIHL